MGPFSFSPSSSASESFIDELDDDLLAAIANTDNKRLALSWPHETIDEFGAPQAYKLAGTSERAPRDGLPTLDDLLQPVRKTAVGERKKKLDSLAVLLFENKDEKLSSGRLPVRKWLSYETDRNGKKYFLHSGRWYIMEQDYAETVHSRTVEIFARPAPIASLPAWTAVYADELAYNKRAAKDLDGLCLDRQLIQGETRRGKFEACDILLRDGTFIHVKHTDSSSPASHLLAQALVSAEILTYDDAARQGLSARIREQGADPEDYQLVPTKVVIVMAKEGKALTPDSLYTFTKVNLGRQDRALATRDVEVFVVPIVKEKKLQDSEDQPTEEEAADADVEPAN